MVDCKSCGETDLRWDQSWFENTGKWRLWSNQKEQPHSCKNLKPISDKDKKPPRMVSCSKCNALGKSKYMREDKLQAHIKKEHIDWGDYT